MEAYSKLVHEGDCDIENKIKDKLKGCLKWMI